MTRSYRCWDNEALNDRARKAGMHRQQYVEANGSRQQVTGRMLEFPALEWNGLSQQADALPPRNPAPASRDTMTMRPGGRIRRLLEGIREHRWSLLSGLLWLFLDLLTKDLASVILLGQPPLEIGLGLRLVHRANPGMLMGFLEGIDPLIRQPLLIGSALMALLLMPALIGWLVKAPVVRGWAICLVYAGALGNLLGRLWDTAVVDFIQFGPPGWPSISFNLADLAILAGVGLVVTTLVRTHAVKPRWSATSKEG